MRFEEPSLSPLFHTICTKCKRHLSARDNEIWAEVSGVAKKYYCRACKESLEPKGE